MHETTKNKNDTLSITFHADALNNRAYQYQYLNNDLDSALFYYNKSYETASLIKSKNTMGIALNNIAFIHQHRGNLEKSIEIYNESIELINLYWGDSPLHLSCYENDIQSVKDILASGFDENSSIK
jgi:tetratricopeptide (TPR) repeat protein